MSHLVTNHLGSHCFTSIDVQGLKLVRCKKTITNTTTTTKDKTNWPTKSFGRQKHLADKNICGTVHPHIFTRTIVVPERRRLFSNTRLCIRNSMKFVWYFYIHHNNILHKFGWNHSLDNKVIKLY